MRLAVLRRSATLADHDKAANLRDWVVRQGNMTALTERLEQVASGHVTIRHDPGVPAIEHLGAIAEGINRELTRQRTITPPIHDLGPYIER